MAATTGATVGRCLDENELQAFVEGGAPAAIAADVEGHIDSCPSCRAKLAELGRALGSRTASRTIRAVAPPDEPREGALVGRYTIVRALGRGAMGIVFLAHDPELDRDIALKLVRAAPHAAGAHARSRVVREAKANARLAHPNVVAVHDVGTFGDHVFIAMELVSAGTLRTALGASPPWQRVLSFYLQAGEGLAAAHAAGLIHRDFKPDNVLIGEDGRARVADFGLARAVVDEADDAPPAAEGAQPLEATLTQSGTLLGTPAYMAPEQIRGKRADARADVFAFSVALFEGLYGRRPFSGRTLAELRESIEAGRIDEPPERAAGDGPQPPEIREAVLRGLAARPDDRWPSMRALLDALHAAGAARAGGPRGRVVAAVVALTALVLAGAGVAGARASGLLDGRGAARPPPPPPPPGSSAVLAPPPDFAPGSFRRITFDDGCEEFPSFTPDGRSVVFDGSDGPDSALFVLSLSDLSRRRLTQVRGWDFAGSVSPDGTEVAFLRSGEGERGTFVVPFDASPAVHPKLVVKGNLRPSWSPDGTAIWAGDHGAFTLHAVDDGRLLRTVEVPPGRIGGQSIELADGRLIATFPFIAEATSGGVGVYSKDGALRMLYEGNVGEVLALLPGPAGHVISVHRLDNAVPALVELALDGSGQLPLGATNVLARKGLAVSPDGKTLVYSTCRGVVSLLRFDETGSAAALAPDPEWDDQDVAPVPGSATELVVMSEQSGDLLPWVVDRVPGVQPRMVNGFGRSLHDVVVSPDRRWLVGQGTTTPAASAAEAGWGGGTIGLLVMDVRGETPPRILTADPTDSDASFDPRGENVLFTRRGDGSSPTMVMTVPFAGGEARPYIGPGAADPSVCAEGGRVIYLQSDKAGDQVPMVWDPRSGARAPLSPSLSPAAYMRPHCSPDGTRALVIRGKRDVIEVDVRKAAVLRTLKHGSDVIDRAVYSGRDVIVLHAGWVGDLWMAALAH